MEKAFPAVRTKETTFHSHKSSCFGHGKGVRILYLIFVARKRKGKSQHFQNTFFRPKKDPAPAVIIPAISWQFTTVTKGDRDFWDVRCGNAVGCERGVAGRN